MWYNRSRRRSPVRVQSQIQQSGGDFTRKIYIADKKKKPSEWMNVSVVFLSFSIKLFFIFLLLFFFIFKYDCSYAQCSLPGCLCACVWKAHEKRFDSRTAQLKRVIRYLIVDKLHLESLFFHFSIIFFSNFSITFFSNMLLFVVILLTHYIIRR